MNIVHKLGKLMTGKRELKKEDLKKRLFDAALKQITKDGLPNLRARDLAKEAGCALGSVYTAYKDLDELILEVNSYTLSLLDDELSARISAGEEPLQRLETLAKGYLSFVKNHHTLWLALFDHKLPNGKSI